MAAAIRVNHERWQSDPGAARVVAMPLRPLRAPAESWWVCGDLGIRSGGLRRAAGREARAAVVAGVDLDSVGHQQVDVRDENGLIHPSRQMRGNGVRRETTRNLDPTRRHRGLTTASGFTHSAHPAGIRPGVSGQKHRSWNTRVRGVLWRCGRVARSAPGRTPLTLHKRGPGEPGEPGEPGQRHGFVHLMSGWICGSLCLRCGLALMPAAHHGARLVPQEVDEFERLVEPVGRR